MSSIRQSSPTPSQLPPVPSSPAYSYASTAAPSTITTTTTVAGGDTRGLSNIASSNMSTFTLGLPPPPPPPAVPYAVLTKSDLAASQAAYADLVATAKAYRIALASLSTAASAFGSALESCARLKEARADCIALAPQHHSTNTGGGAATIGTAPAPATAPPSSTAAHYCTADTLLAAAGVHHLVANHEQILSETVYRSFEVPLLHELDKWRASVEDEEARYLAAVKRQSADIRRLEKEGLRLHRQRGPRDVGKFRSHLVELTTKLDGLTGLHGEHARTLLRESQDTSVKILDASCSLVRAEVDIFESLARKGWSGGGLDDLLEKGTDLFSAAHDEEDAFGGHSTGDVTALIGDEYGNSGSGENKLFSILPPRSILADATSDSGILVSSTAATRGRDAFQPSHANHGNGGGRGRTDGHTRADSLGVASEPYQSLAGAVFHSTNGSLSRDNSRGRQYPYNNDYNNKNKDNDAASTFSASAAEFGSPRAVAGGASRLRMTRPFSPQPVRVRVEDVMGGDGEEQQQTEKRASEDESDDETEHGNDSNDNERDEEETEEEEDEDEDEDDSGPMSPATIRDVDVLDDSDNERHPWNQHHHNTDVAASKRISSAASDPEERERRWHVAGSDDE